LLAPVHPETSSRLHAVVFDMDGVLVDSHPAHRLAWREFLRTLGKEVTESELDFVLEGGKRDEILVHFLGPLTEAELRDYGRRKSDLFWRAASEVAPIPGVYEFIECVHRAGIPMAVATSASSSRTRSILKRLGLLAHFTAVVTGDEVRGGKPDPGIYLLACQRMNCPPSAAVAVEDAAAGVLAAKRAGLRCVAITKCGSEEKLTAAGADCVLPDFVNLTLQRLHSLVGMQPQHSGTPECSIDHS